MKCKKCGSDNEDGKKFCSDCGTKLIAKEKTNKETEIKEDIKKEKKKKSVGKIIGDVIRYIIGGFFVLSGIISFDLSGIFIFICGLLIMPFIYDMLAKKIKFNKVLFILMQIFIPIIIFSIFASILPKEYLIEKDIVCDSKYILSSNSGEVYYYCLKDFKVYTNKKYESLDHLYPKEAVNSVLKKMENTFTKIEFEDDSILYSCSYYNMLKCSNGDIYIGDNTMIYQDGFCGKMKAPETKNNNKNKKNENNTEKSKKNSKNEKKYNEQKEQEEKNRIFNEIKGYFYVTDSLTKIDKKNDKFIVSMETNYYKGKVSSNPEPSDAVEHIMDIINNIKTNKPEIDQIISEYKWTIKSNSINTKTSYKNNGEASVSQITLKIDNQDVTITQQNIIDKKNAAREAAERAEQEAAAAKAAEEAEKRKKDTSVIHGIGETVKCPYFDVTINSFAIKGEGTYIDSYYYISDPEWIGVILTVTNTSTDTHTFGSSYITLQNSTGEIITHKFWNYDIWGAEMLNSPKLVPQGTKTGYVSFANTNQDNSNLILLVSCNDHLLTEDTTYKFQLQ